MLELSAMPEAGFISLDEFCKTPTYTEGQVILFDNDDDFLSSCVAPVAVIDMDKDGNPYSFHGQFTEMYQKCLKAGMKFGIRRRDSFVNKNKVADARVLVPEGFNQLRKDINVQLRVQGIEILHAWYYLCDGQVYTRRSIVAQFVYQLIYKQGKTEEEVRRILQSCCQDVLSNEQFEELDQEGKDQYKSFSIKRVKYHYREMEIEDLIKIAAQNGVRIENLVIS